MSAIAETADHVSVELIAELPSKPARNYLKELGSFGSLAVVSAAAFYAQNKGVTEKMSYVPRTFAESCSHPVLGYSGGYIGYKLSESRLAQKVAPRLSGKVIAWAFVGATAANFATEGAQANVLDSERTHFLKVDQLDETLKDWGFALAGMVWLLTLKTRDRKP